jgi:hypothetical protein
VPDLRVNGDGPKQGAVGVQLERSGTNDLTVFSRHKHRQQMLVDAGERQMHSLEQRADLGQVTLSGGFDHESDSCARGAQHVPPAGLSSTYSCPNAR